MLNLNTSTINKSYASTINKPGAHYTVCIKKLNPFKFKLAITYCTVCPKKKGYPSKSSVNTKRSNLNAVTPK